jgi:tRNA(fMet)-specific endonuclease VapC
MTHDLYILDTDHLSLYGRNHPAIVTKLKTTQVQFKTTVISVEEQLRGRLAQVAEARDEARKAIAYQWLTATLTLLSEFQVLEYDEKAQAIYQTLKEKRLRVGRQDLRIACIVFANEGTLLTRNLRDFEKIPGILNQNWSI